MDEVLTQARDWMEAGHKVALATVTATWGSSPRPIGSQLAVNDKAAFAGSVSGGCIETFVVSEALDIMETGEPRLLEYGVSDEQAREVQLACGGTVKVFVEPAPSASDLERLIAAQPIARMVSLDTGEALILDREGEIGVLSPPPEVVEKARGFLRSDSSDMAYAGEKSFFVKTYAPPRRMVIIGAVHIAQALAPMAVTAGFDVTVIDPRPLFTRDDRMPGLDLVAEHPSRVFQSLELTRRTAVVALAHDPDLDDPALKAALGSDAYYIGALGSKKNHAKRLDRLGKAGFNAEALARIHGPIGLDIGGRSPAHIALSILAEIIAVGNGKA